MRKELNYNIKNVSTLLVGDLTGHARRGAKVSGVVGAEQEGALVVDAVHVRHEQEQVGADEDGEASGQAVVVLDADEALEVDVLFGRRGDRVVRVEDGHDAQVEELAQSRLQVASRVLVVEVGLGDEHLGCADPVLGEHGIVQGHQAALSRRGTRPWVDLLVENVTVS